MHTQSSFKPRSLASALISCKCPQCRVGNMYKTGPYNLSRFSEMPENCEHCGFRFEVEPGFFWGAMYISYAFTVAISINVSLLLWWYGGNPGIWVYAGVLSVILLGLSPLMLRYSRVVMLYMFGSVSFDRKKFESGKSSE